MVRRHGVVAVSSALVAMVTLAPLARLVAQDAPATPTSVVDGVFTNDQAERGKKQFQQTCAACHTAAEHTGKNFESRWSGSTVGDLFDLVSNTMPESDPGGLKADQYASILAFFLSESGYKEGTTELPSDLESLKKIRIDTPIR
jgi:mono/diheme cytochrome c family protein